MNEFLVLTLIVPCLIIAGCGGDSDSSGSKFNPNQNEPIQFVNLPNCRISDNLVSIPQVRGCKMRTPKLNKGNIFSLECLAARPSGNLIRAQARKSDDLQSIINDIKTETHYKYYCLPYS